MDAAAGWLAGASLGLLIVVFSQLVTLQKRVTRLSRVEAKVDALMQHAGIEFDPFKFVAKEVVEALKNGDKIEAIRVYRDHSGASLKEAKDFVEELQRRAETNN